MPIQNVHMAGFVASADQTARARQASDPNQQRFMLEQAAAMVQKKADEHRTKVEDFDESALVRRYGEDEQSEPGGYDSHGRKDQADDDDDEDEHPHIDLVA